MKTFLGGRRLVSAAILAVLSGALLPRLSWAEAEPGLGARPLASGEYSEFSFFQFRAGQAWPVGGLGGLGGLVAGAGINVQKTHHWGVGLDIDNFSFNKNTQPTLAPEPVNLIRKDLAVIGTVRYLLLPGRPISPVFTAGLGVHYFDVTHSHTEVPGSKHDGPGASHTGLKVHRGFGYKGAGMLGVEVTGRGPESLVWTVAARWFLLPEPRQFRTSLSSVPGQALTLTAAIGLDL